MEAEDLTVLAYRFEGDTYYEAGRFAALAGAMGDGFVPTVLSDSSGAPDGWVGVPTAW